MSITGRISLTPESLRAFVAKELKEGETSNTRIALKISDDFPSSSVTLEEIAEIRRKSMGIVKPKPQKDPR